MCRARILQPPSRFAFHTLIHVELQFQKNTSSGFACGRFCTSCRNVRAAHSGSIAKQSAVSLVASERCIGRRRRTNGEGVAEPGTLRCAGRSPIEEGSTENIFHGELELNQLVLFPGKRQLLVAIAQRNVAISKLALEGLRFQLMTAVRKGFYEMLAAQQIAGLRKEQIESAKTFYEAAVKRAESGYASDFEAVKGQAELIDAQKLARAVEGQIASARVELNTLLGRDPSSPLKLKGSLQNAAPRGTSNNYVTLAMTRNPSLRTQEMQAQLAGLNLRKARLGRRPDFAIGPRVEYTDRERTYGFGATVALPLWNQSQGEIQTAAGEEQKEIAAVEKLQAEIAGAVIKAAATLDVSRDQLTLYTPAFLDRLKTFVAQAEKSYAQNATTVLIYLDAKRTYFEALASYYEAQGHFAASRAELESAIGVPVDLETSELGGAN